MRTTRRPLPAHMRRRATATAVQRTLLTPQHAEPWRVGHYDGPTDVDKQIEHAKFLATGIVQPVYWHNPGACLSLLMAAQALDIPRHTALQNLWWNPAVGLGAMKAQLMASLLTERHNFEFKIVEESDQRVAMTFHRVVDGRRRKLGDVEWTILEAVAACLTWREQWQRHPKDMLWARCLMRGARRFASSVGTGLAYTRDELDDMSAAEEGGEVALAVKAILAEAAADTTPSDRIRGELLKAATKQGLIGADTGGGEPLGRVLGLLWGQARAREVDAAQTVRPGLTVGPPAEAEPAGTGTLPCGCPAREFLRRGRHVTGVHE